MAQRLRLEELQRILSHKRRIYPYHLTLNSKSLILETTSQKFILKERYPSYMANECRVLRFLQKNKFPNIPRFYGLARIDGKLMMVQEFIEGEKIERNKPLFNVCSDKIASILANLHLLKMGKKRNAGFFVDGEIKSLKVLLGDIKIISSRKKPFHLKDFLIEGEKCFDLLLETIKRKQGLWGSDIRPSIISGELEFIRNSSGMIYLLDWENPHFGDYAYDIADLRYIYQEMDLKGFIEKFKRQSGVTDDIYARVLVYYPLILIKELFYYILEFNTCEFYSNLPIKLMMLFSKASLQNKFNRISIAQRKLNSLKYP